MAMLKILCLVSVVAQSSALLSKPDPPVLDAIQCSDKYATIRWHPTAENHATINRYTVQYITDFTDTWDVANDYVPGLESSLIVALSPWANYTFRVIARNEIGSSAPSDHSAVCVTEPDVPFKNPDNVRGRGTAPHNLVISWSVMPQIDHNGPDFYYKVSYKRNTIGEIWHEKIITDWQTNELIVQHTPTYVPYRIKVLAYNSKGAANVPPTEVIGWSGEDKPLLAPANFTLIEIISGTEALFSWDLVPLDSVRGRLLGYRIQVTVDGETRNVLVQADITHALVSVLEPLKKNQVRIMAYNSYERGPYSQLNVFPREQEEES